MKKVLAFILAIVMGTMLLAACAGSDSQPESAVSAKSATPSSEVEPESLPQDVPETEPPEQPAGGGELISYTYNGLQFEYNDIHTLQELENGISISFAEGGAALNILGMDVSESSEELQELMAEVAISSNVSAFDSTDNLVESTVLLAGEVAQSVTGVGMLNDVYLNFAYCSLISDGYLYLVIYNNRLDTTNYLEDFASILNSMTLV